MGDDGTPRTVQAGSIIVGNTANDGDGAATYRITNQNKGKLSWTCNADHILVLKFNVRPCKVLKDPTPGLALPYYYSQIETNAENIVEQRVHSFATEAEAEEAREHAVATWTPLVWEGSVNEYLKFGQAVRQLALLYQPSDPLPFKSSEPSLQQRLTEAYAANGQEGRQATKEEAEFTAWVIGMWLTDGHANRPVISQIALDANHPDQSHTAVILKLEDWYSKVYGVPASSGVAADGQPIAEYLDLEGPSFSPSSVAAEGEVFRWDEHPLPALHVNQITWPNQISTAGNMAYDIRLGPIMRKLLESYGILDEKYFPTELLADTPAVRWQLLAGVVDGDGQPNPDRLIEVSAKERRFIEGLVHLARGLGFSTGKVGEKRCTNEDTGEVYKGFRINIGGENLHKIQTALMYKRFSPRPPSKANKDQSCDGFKVERVDHANYYGFTLDGNGRCLLGDFTVSHNTVVCASYLAGAFYSRQCKRVLLLAPLSVLGQWERELQKWAGASSNKSGEGLRLLMLTSSGSKSKQAALEADLRTLMTSPSSGGVVLTTYGLLASRAELFGAGAFTNPAIQQWDICCADEGHKIKNSETQLSKILRMIPISRRILLTGTPIMNDLDELWSLFDWTSHGTLLGDRTTFRTQFTKPIMQGIAKGATVWERDTGQALMEEVKKRIAPFFLRREKSILTQVEKPEEDASERKEDGVAPSRSSSEPLPSSSSSASSSVARLSVQKNDLILWLHMSPLQISLYSSFLSSDRVKSIFTNSTRSPLVALSVLKKICDHPRLLSEEMKLCEDLEEIGRLRQIPDATSQENIQRAVEMLTDESSKMRILEQLLKSHIANGHRTLVFSQSRKMLSMISLLLTRHSWKSLRIDGQISDHVERQRRMDKFNADSTYQVFILTTRSGGVGLNLVGADRVIIMDPDW
jgi:hypothetical protein